MIKKTEEKAPLCNSTNRKRKIAQRLTGAIVNVITIGIDMDLMSLSIVMLILCGLTLLPDSEIQIDGPDLVEYNFSWLFKYSFAPRHTCNLLFWIFTFFWTQRKDPRGNYTLNNTKNCRKSQPRKLSFWVRPSIIL